jgi:predicted small secreted protein
MTPWNALRRRTRRGRAPARASAAWRPRQASAATVLAALLLGACGTSEGTGDRASLAGSPARETPSPDESEPRVAPVPGGGPTPVGGRPWDDRVSQECSAAVTAGTIEVAQTPDGEGVTSSWSGPRQVAVCDVLFDEETGAPQAPITSTAPRAASAGFDERRLSLSSAVVGPLGADPAAVRFVAGGLLPWPVDEISYTFPDGHTAQARFTASDDGSGDTWWVVTYTATDGPLVDPGTFAGDLDPVTISIVGAAAEAFRLPWEDLQRDE